MVSVKKHDHPSSSTAILLHTQPSIGCRAADIRSGCRLSIFKHKGRGSKWLHAVISEDLTHGAGRYCSYKTNSIAFFGHDGHVFAALAVVGFGDGRDAGLFVDSGYLCWNIGRVTRCHGVGAFLDWAALG